MMRRIGVAIVAVVLVMATGVGAHQIIHGNVLRIDPQAGVIVFDDGRMVQTTADSMILSGNQRMAFMTLQPGTPVAVYEGVPVVMRDGRYSAFGQWHHPHVTYVPPASQTYVPPATSYYVTPPQAVVTPPPAVVQVPAVGRAYRTDTQVYPVFETSGVVLKADEVGGRISLTDGRTIHVDTDSQVLVNNHPVMLSGLRAGTPVVIRSIKPFWGANSTYAPLRPVASGTVLRVDGGNALVLSDGRIVQVVPGTVIMVDNRPAAIGTVRPGTYVILYDQGQAVLVDAPAASPPIYPDAGLREREAERPSGQ